MCIRRGRDAPALPGPPVSVPNGRYAFDRCAAHPLPENRLLVTSHRTGRQTLLAPEVYDALLECQRFRTTSGHVARLLQSHPSARGRAGEVRQMLEQVARKGLMLQASAALAQLCRPSSQPPDGGPPVVAIMTWERPAALQRLLGSLKAHCDLRRIERLYVIDDSRSPAAASRNRHTTEEFALGAAAPVHYLGACELAALLEELVRRLPERRNELGFLIDRDRWAGSWTCGLARNIALLLSAGRRVIVLDDDILCEVHDTGSGPPLVAFGDRAREARFYHDREEWAGLRARHDSDPLQRHARLLGLPLGQALTRLGGAPAEDWLDEAPRRFIERLDPQMPLLVTQCGSLGDPGTRSNRWLAHLDRRSTAELLASEERVRAALETRHAWCGRSRDRFMQASNMSQMIGLDNRQLLPCYLPDLRGQDQVFGDMVEFLHPGAAVLDAAWALPHLPMEQRSWDSEAGRYGADVPFPAFFLTLPQRSLDHYGGARVERRFGPLAGLFDDLAGSGTNRLLELHREHRLRTLSRRYSRLAELRTATGNAPACWNHWLDDGLRTLEAALAAPVDEDSLAGFPAHLQGPALVEYWRGYWAELAAALRAWPVIHAGAARMGPWAPKRAP